MLAEKYRPTTLDEVKGQDHIKSSLATIVARDDLDIPHTYIFYGKYGSGKTTMSFILAKELGCHAQSIMEMDAADVGRIDTARQIKEQICQKPFFGKKKVYIFDECQSASKEFWESMLKTLEKPPKHVYFILCTTNKAKIPATILSRCTQFEIKPFSSVALSKLLKEVLSKEGISDFPQKAITQISEMSDGSPRNALSLLDKVIDITDDKEIISILEYDVDPTTKDLIDALYKGANWSVIGKLLKSLEGEDHERLRRGILGYFSKVLMNKNDTKAAEIIDCFKTPFFDSGWPGLVLACYRVNL